MADAKPSEIGRKRTRAIKRHAVAKLNSIGSGRNGHGKPSDENEEGLKPVAGNPRRVLLFPILVLPGESRNVDAQRWVAGRHPAIGMTGVASRRGFWRRRRTAEASLRSP